ncbi:MAG: ABC transporter permease subunit [Chloroflexota bacterium]|nr:ABC transporter permease subunit [Chloroflexota bacterium]
MEAIKERGVQLLSLVLLVAVWEGLSLVVGRLVPSPVAVFPVAWNMITSGSFADPLFTSLYRLLFGFGLALALGLAFGIASAQVEKLGIAAGALFTTIMTTPSLVIIFVAMLILGQTDSTIVLIVGLIVFPFVAVPMRDAMKDLDQDILGMSKSFKVTTRRKLIDVYIPYLVPPILAASRIGFSLSWKIVVLSEVFGFTTGVGWKISLAYFQYDLVALMAWLVIFVVIILVIEQVIREGERRVVKWK